MAAHWQATLTLLPDAEAAYMMISNDRGCGYHVVHMALSRWMLALRIYG